MTHTLLHRRPACLNPLSTRAQILGSDAVTYHEGLGHALAMPHPLVSQKLCVMDMGMYQKLPLLQLEICAEIKMDMAASSAGGASSASPHLHMLLAPGEVEALLVGVSLPIATPPEAGDGVGGTGDAATGDYYEGPAFDEPAYSCAL